MRKLTFGMNLSLDGYIAAPGDDLGWSVPSAELFQWWSDRVGAVAEVGSRVLAVPLAPSSSGDPARCRPIGCYEAPLGLATTYRRDRDEH